MATETTTTDYTLANPDTLTKYKTAGEISQKVLKTVAEWVVDGDGANIIELCEKGDKLIEEEVGKVFKGKKLPKGQSHPTTISPSSYITPYTPLKSEAEEAGATLKKGEVVKIQLGAQIDGLGTIVCDNVVVGEKGEITGRTADLLLATHYANELLLRLLLPPGTLATTEEEKAAAPKRAYTQSQINALLEKVVKSYDANIVESTTGWLFGHNEIEGEKKIILNPGEGVRGEGTAEIGEVWGIEVGVSLGSGKVKTLNQRTTLHRRTNITYSLKRPSSRATLSEVTKKFGNFPFSLRQLEDERAGKVGIVESVRANLIRQYEVVADKDNEPVARLLTTIAITKNGIQRVGAPLPFDVSKYKSDKKITDEEILKILETPSAKASTNKNKPKKKKKKAKNPAAAAAAAEEEESEEDSDDE